MNIETEDVVTRLRSDWRRTPTGELKAQREEAAGTIERLREVIRELELRVAEDDARWSQITVRAAQVDRSPEGQDGETRLDRNDESAVPKGCAQNGFIGDK